MDVEWQIIKIEMVKNRMMNKFENIFPLVSVVVTTKEEEEYISNHLISIKSQTYKNIEIIVVDNGSIDKTKTIAQKYTKKVFDKGPERSAQRNYGLLEKSNGKYLLYLDADMILEKNLVEECVKQIQKTKAAALHIPEKIMGKSFFSRVRNFERSFYNGTVVDGSRFFNKEAFIKTGGFNEQVTGQEDWSMDLQIKKNRGKIHLLKSSWINHNESEFNLKKYLDKKGYYSKTFNIYKEKWKGHPDLKKQLGLYYRFIGVFIEDGKYKKILKHPILFCGIMYLRFRVGIRYLKRDRNGS